MIDKDGNELSIKTLHQLVVKDNRADFLLKIRKKDIHFIDFEVYKVCSWTKSKRTGIFDNPSELELYLTGFIKWDGCSHIWFGEEEDGKQDGYLHLCGKYCWDKHVQLMVELFEFANKEMGVFVKQEKGE